ncbi:MAG: FAD-dependent monooxygenase [Candidatus Lokiarchaeota archaeon]|nr:FAD-dependent monooxygenase [Candidatus Lokiarchaeota archaeon]
MVENCDILIVGAGTAGSYLGWILAKKGFSVVIIEKDKREEVGKRLDVIHFETDRIEKAGIPPFHVGEPDCIEIRNHSIVVTPDFTKEIKIQALQTIVRLTPFLNRMYDILESVRAKLEFSCKFKNLIYKDNNLIGLKAEKNGLSIEYHAKLIVDASGKVAVIRTSLPQDYGIETFELGPNDVMYVLLQYIKWKNAEEPHPATDTGYNWWLLWFGPSYDPDGAILGVGQPGSFENARLSREDFLKRANLPPYEIIKKEQGSTPYRRPPYSLVGDRFLCIGDAAALTYPFSGHGVTATWMLCMIASDVIEKRLRAGKDLSRDILWDINVKYFRDQGAKFAGLFTQLSGVLNFNEKEWNYFLKKGLIYQTGEGNDIPEPNKEYEEDMSLGDMLKFLFNIIGGLIRRKLSFKHMKRLLQANSLAGKIKKHYENYPENLKKFGNWVEKADFLWAQKKLAVKKLSSVKIEYL